MKQDVTMNVMGNRLTISERISSSKLINKLQTSLKTQSGVDAIHGAVTFIGETREGTLGRPKGRTPPRAIAGPRRS